MQKQNYLTSPINKSSSAKFHRELYNRITVSDQALVYKIYKLKTHLMGLKSAHLIRVYAMA